MPRLNTLRLLLCALAGAAPAVGAVAAGGQPAATAAAPARAEAARLKALAQRVTIVRDQWGIPHVFGKTDADAVFGLLYAQAEDDFHRIELNYINAMGRLAEVRGEAELYRDLRMKLFIDPDSLKAQAHPCEKHPGRRGERRSRVAALHRPGGNVCAGGIQGSAVLP